MTESRPTSQPRDSRVQAALQDYLERLDRGDSVDREEFLAEHPDIADELRSFIATDENMVRLAGLKASASSSVARRDAQTLAPQKVQGKSAVTDSGQLPAQFGRYRVLKPLGSGAMGTVYLAEDTQLQRKVALKTPSFDEDDSGELLERFYREARSAATLRHSNICPVFDVGEIDGRHFISMAYIEGRPLSAYIQPDNPQPERQVLLIIRKLALALREAHEHGIVHRDLKPGNVMIDPRGEPIIMDFGLARRVATDEDHRITQSGVLVGSPAYMSPEQVEGDPDRLGPASDQYSLGVILYELLTGQLPFRGSIAGVIGQILTKEPTPPGQLRAGLDPRIEALCRRMMAKPADDRFPSIKDVADEVARILKTPSPSSTRSAATEGSANAAAPAQPHVAAPSITASNVQSLYEAARKCMRKRDYEQVIQILETLPEHKRNDEVIRLLLKARQRSDDIQFLLAEIDEALRLNDAETALKKAEELLELKPGHHRAKQVREECSRYGGLLFFRRRRRTEDERHVGEGSWIPRAAVVVFLVAFGVASWLVYDYLHSEGMVLDPEDVAEVERESFGTVRPDATLPVVAREEQRVLPDSWNAHAAPVHTVDVSADGRWAVTGAKDGSVRVWNLDDASLVAELTGAVDAVEEARIASDGRWVAASVPARQELRVWSLDPLSPGSAKEFHTFSNRDDGFLQVGLSHDGGAIITGGLYQVRLYDTVDRKLLHSYGTSAYGTAVSPDGRSAAFGGWNRYIDLYDTGRWTRIARLEGHAGHVYALAFSGDGRRLASGDGARVLRVWDVQSGDPLAELRGHRAPVQRVVLSRDGSRVASWAGDDARVWNVDEGKQILEVPDSLRPALSPDGNLLLTGHSDGTVHVHRLPAIDATTGPPVQHGPEAGDNAFPFPQDARFTEARALSELNEPGIVNAYPWIAPDGLTIYWTREGDGTSSIRQATRASIDAPFGNARTVLENARLASVSPDGLEIVCLFDADSDGETVELCGSRRSGIGDVFPRPGPIESLQSLNRPKGTAFSPDGLSLLILESGDPEAGSRNRVLISHRPGPTAEWGPAEPLTIQGQVDEDGLTWPSFDASGDHLLFSYGEPGTRYLEWGGVADRTADPLTFSDSRPLLLDGERFVTRGGRYCAASGELFYTRPIGSPPYQEMQLWMAKSAPLSIAPPRPVEQVSLAAVPATLTNDPMNVGFPRPDILVLNPPDNGETAGTFHLRRAFVSFSVSPRIQPARGAGDASPLTFSVLGDGNLLWESQPVTSANDQQTCQVDVRNVNALQLKVRRRGRARTALATWFQPRLSWEVPEGLPPKPQAPWPVPLSILDTLDRQDGAWPIKFTGADWLGMHPPRDGASRIRFRLGNQFEWFRSIVRVGREVGGVDPAGVITFRALGDGKLLWKSREFRTGRELELCDVNVTGVDVLELHVTCSGPNQAAHAYWYQPYVFSTPLSEIDFEFQDNNEGWFADRSMSPVAVEDGVLRSRVLGRDPYLTRTFLNVAPDQYSRIVVRIRISGSHDNSGAVFWQTASQPLFSDARYVSFETNPDGEFHDYVIEVGEHELWQGQRIKGLRLDPEFRETVGATIEIDSIRGE